MSGETPDLSGGAGGSAGAGGAPAAGGVGAGGSAGGAGAGGVGAGGTAAGGAGAAGAGGVGGAAGSQLVPILIAGGLTGVIAMGALVALNVVPVHSGGSGASPRGLVLVACPGSGPVLAVVDPGQKLLVTGRSSDGSWLQVYLPGPALPYAWAPARELQASGDTSGLPVVAGCEVAAASPSGSPIVAIASPSGSAGAGPTPTPTPTPTPSPTPTNSSPIIADLVASPATIYYAWSDPSHSCGPDAKDPDTTTISASITDPQGVASATLVYKLPSGSYVTKAMTGTGARYTATVNVPSGFGHTGSLDYYVVSKDKSAEEKTRTSPLKQVTIRKCDRPPKVSDSAVPSGPIRVPVAGGGACPADPTNYIFITAFATDPDDAVASIVFYYRPYPTTTSKLEHLTLTRTSTPGLFTGKLYNTNFPKLPKNGLYNTSPWYLVAIDAAGRSSPKYSQGTASLQETQC